MARITLIYKAFKKTDQKVTGKNLNKGFKIIRE